MGGSRDSVKEEIRQRVGILDVVSEYVSLKRAGKSSKGLCPFHSEKTPSFTVSEEFQTWHCFGCGEHGDVFAFLMKIENLTFPEALERLAKRAGVELERFESRRTSRKELLSRINSLAAAYYSELLKQTPAALDYLRSRGLADQTIQQFRLGYAAPAWDGFVGHVTKKDIRPNDAVQAGLVIRSDRGSYYDRFRNRIIFPIFDIQERVIGFGGRALGDEEPKYVNSPETPLFSKTRSLYALNLARKSIAENGHAIIVEGYTDAIAAHQAGFSNCAATLGTALTLDHIRVLSRYAKRVVLAYDADSAGMTAALRGAAMFDEAECDVRIARLPGGDDPDSLLSKGRVSEFEAAMSEALPIVDYKLAILREQYDLSDPAGRATMLKHAVRLLADVPAAIEREKYIRGLARYHPNFESGTTRAEEHIRRDVELFAKRRSGTGRKLSADGVPKPTTALERAERSVLSILIRGEAGAETIVGSLAPEDFSNETGRAAAVLLFDMFQEKKGIYLPDLLEIADENLGRYLSELAMRDEGPPVDEKALQDYVALIENAKTKKLRTSDVLAPYLKQGVIDSSEGPHGQTIEELEAFLRKSGKLPGDDKHVGDETE